MERSSVDREHGEPQAVDLRASLTPGVHIEQFSQSSGAGRNLPFTLVFSSGQDEDYPATELNKGIQGRGWQSSRFCFYPQELILELKGPSRIMNMQLLCHENKIPSKVEVFVSLSSPWIHSEKAVSQMKRLGYLSLDPNERSGHQARELKSIHVDAPGAAIRLVLHSCYNNKYNTYNQVGLVALIVTGEPLDEQQLSQIRQRGYSPLLQTPRTQVSCSEVVDAALHAVDPTTAARIHRLQQEKLIAVQEEDYDEAKRLKNFIEKLKVLGEQIKQLELRKRAAVEAEDYDVAKSCKMEIERLRLCGETGHERLSSSKQSEVSTSENDPTKNLSPVTTNICYQTPLPENSIEDHLDKSTDLHANQMQGYNIDGQRASANDPEMQSELFQAEGMPNGEKRQGRLPTVFSWWKGKEPSRSSDEDFKSSVLEYSHADHQSSTSKQNLPASQHTKVGLYMNSDEASTSKQKPSTIQHPQPGTYISPDQVVYLDQPSDHSATSSQQRSKDTLSQQLHAQSQSQVERTSQHVSGDQQLQHAVNGQQRLPTHPVMEVSTRDMPYMSTVSSSTEIPRNGHTRLSTGRPLIQTSKNGHKISDARPQVDSYSRHVPEPETRSSMAQFSFHASVPEQNGSQASHDHDTSVPEPLTDVLRAEVGPLLSIIDLYYVECLCSKQWQLRDKALQHIIKLLQARGLTGDPSAHLKLLDIVVLRAINDRVPNIYYGSLQLLKEYVVKYSGEVPPREIQHGVGAFVSILLDKLGESNVRIRDAAAETITFLASKREVGLGVVTHHLLKSPKNQATWRPVLGRLQWLLSAIPMFGLQPSSKMGFVSEALMAFVNQAFNSPNGEVRNAAVKVTTEVYKLMGGTVERYLKGIKPIIREVLMNNFQKFALDNRVMEDCNPLTYEEIDNMPIVRKTQKSISMMYESDSVSTDPAPKKHSEGGLHAMVVEQQERHSDGLDDQHMYSNQATAPVVTSSFEEEENTEEELLTTNCANLSPRLDARAQELYAVSTATTHDFEELQFAGKDDFADQCLFCGKQDPSFLHGDNLDMHFCQKCPMLVGCGNCKQIVEIATLKEHYLYECASGRKYVECLKCSQVVPEVRLTSHLRSKECRHGKHHKSNRCPLCHHSVEHGDAGWSEHLLKPPGCSKNPRTRVK